MKKSLFPCPLFAWGKVYQHCMGKGIMYEVTCWFHLLPFDKILWLLFQSEGLTPMLEVALGQVEARCERAGLAVAGYYHANRSLKDNGVDVFSQKIADKVAENALTGSRHSGGQRGGGGSSAALVTIDNKRLSLVLETPALLVQMVSDSGGGTVGEGG